MDEAVGVAGGGEAGRALVDRLAGRREPDGSGRHGPLRLITITGEAGGERQSVNLIHETLIRSKGLNAEGKPQPYWPTLWDYVERNRKRAARRERLQLLAREWKERRGFARLFGLAGWSAFFGYRRLAAPGSLEARYLRWSRARALVQAAFLTLVLVAVTSVIEGLYWAASRALPLEVALDRWTYFVFPRPLPDSVQIPPASSPAPSFLTAGDRNPEEQPFHGVTYAPFHIGPTEVTFEQWDVCVADGGCGGYRPRDEGWGRGKQPVINVSWDDAQTYIAWLSRKTGTTCRLPNEAEWEYACRAGSEKEFALPKETGGSDEIAGLNLANCVDCGSEWDGRQTAPVASFPANAWDLHDMHGNVWEWVEDCWVDKASGTDCGTRVARGGSWYINLGGAGCAERGGFAPNYRNSLIGFRVVCSSPIKGR